MEKRLENDVNRITSALACHVIGYHDTIKNSALNYLPNTEKGLEDLANGVIRETFNDASLVTVSEFSHSSKYSNTPYMEGLTPFEYAASVRRNDTTAIIAIMTVEVRPYYFGWAQYKISMVGATETYGDLTKECLGESFINMPDAWLLEDYSTEVMFANHIDEENFKWFQFSMLIDPSYYVKEK